MEGSGSSCTEMGSLIRGQGRDGPKSQLLTAPPPLHRHSWYRPQKVRTIGSGSLIRAQRATGTGWMGHRSIMPRAEGESNLCLALFRHCLPWASFTVLCVWSCPVRVSSVCPVECICDVCICMFIHICDEGDTHGVWCAMFVVCDMTCSMLTPEASRIASRKDRSWG